MKRIILVFLITMMATLGLTAQDKDIMFGIGTSFNMNYIIDTPDEDGLEYPSTTVMLLFPIQLWDYVRVEPQIGYFSVTSSKSTSGAFGIKTDRTRSFLNIGAGLFYTYKLPKSAYVYAGGRINYAPYTENTKVTTVNDGKTDERKSTQHLVNGSISIGGEYFLSEHLSIGIEAGFSYYRFSSPEREPEPVSQPASSFTIYSHTALILARFYI